MTYLGRLTAVVATSLAVAGCFSWDGGGGGCAPAGNGLTGNGSFTYVCVSAADPECDGRLTFDATPSLPRAVARGGHFRLLYGASVVTPVSSKVVGNVAGTSGRDFVALRSGSAGFVVLADAEAVDAVRLEFVEADSLAIGRVGGASFGSSLFGEAERLAVYTPVLFRAAALEGGVPLAGALTDVAWTVDPPELATIFTGLGTCEVTGRAPGTGRLLASRGGLVAELRIRVDATAPIVDAGEDAAVSDASDDADVDPPDAGDDGGDP
ncbi:MAG: hypothetical protein KIS78_32475 [Labilithrix sp.]|nr:hypothetical protein [Labilithrix sp.]MCW5837155.1 hypothetical protein [Labilithrix sp.]